MAPQQNTTGIVQYDEEQLRQYLDQRIREAVVSVMEAVLEAEAQEMVQVAPYERTNLRRDQRNGKRKRRLETRVGRVELKVPRLRMIPFQSTIIERYLAAVLLASSVEFGILDGSSRAQTYRIFLDDGLQGFSVEAYVGIKQ